jgi:hypothetical protein
VVRELKQRCGLRYVFCWHAMAGYWSGCMPGVRRGEEGSREHLRPHRNDHHRAAPSPRILKREPAHALSPWSTPAGPGRCAVPPAPHVPAPLPWHPGGGPLHEGGALCALRLVPCMRGFGGWGWEGWGVMLELRAHSWSLRL